jgi:hypothetical protein
MQGGRGASPPVELDFDMRELVVHAFGDRMNGGRQTVIVFEQIELAAAEERRTQVMNVSTDERGCPCDCIHAGAFGTSVRPTTALPVLSSDTK